MKNNACCPEGLFWDPIKSCCTRTLWCNPSCGQDEICTNITNSATCVCNNDFYKNSTTADITPFITCGFGTIEVYVASRCLLDYLGYDYRNLHLGDTACTFSYVSYHSNKPVVILQLKSESGWCGNKLTMDSSSFHYTNTLHIGIKNETLITVNPIFFDFTCSYNLAQNTSLSSSIHISSCTSNSTNTTQSIINSKNNVTGSLDVIMMAFTDASFGMPITTDSTLYVGTDIYLQTVAPYVEAGVFSLKVLRCFAAPTNSRSDSKSIEFVTNGCPTSNDKILTNIISNGNSSDARIKFRLFQFQGYDDLFIFCDVTVCTGNCSVQCAEELSSTNIGAGLSDSLSGADPKCYVYVLYDKKAPSPLYDTTLHHGCRSHCQIRTVSYHTLTIS
ncbi:uromodulin-like [Dendrobates tinctorius]|uniref:uromodulin-like n=1 Tax=Dendrobates tinctorius TaxID=92724 RepID=UPI003CCA4490